jgi:hypothetical protein
VNSYWLKRTLYADYTDAADVAEQFCCQLLQKVSEA